MRYQNSQEVAEIIDALNPDYFRLKRAAEKSWRELSRLGAIKMMIREGWIRRHEALGVELRAQRMFDGPERKLLADLNREIDIELVTIKEYQQCESDRNYYIHLRSALSRSEQQAARSISSKDRETALLTPTRRLTGRRRL